MSNRTEDKGTRPKRIRKRRLNRLSDCKRYLADLVYRLEIDEIDSAKAGKLTYMINSIAGLIRDHEFEERLAALESQIEEQNESSTF